MPYIVFGSRKHFDYKSKEEVQRNEKIKGCVYNLTTNTSPIASNI